jgi:hypothetical protein
MKTPEEIAREIASQWTAILGDYERTVLLKQIAAAIAREREQSAEQARVIAELREVLNRVRSVCDQPGNDRACIHATAIVDTVLYETFRTSPKSQGASKVTIPKGMTPKALRRIADSVGIRTRSDTVARDLRRWADEIEQWQKGGE